VLGEGTTQVPVPDGEPGETMSMMRWDANFLANISIRQLIAAVACAGEVTTLADLL